MAQAPRVARSDKKRDQSSFVVDWFYALWVVLVITSTWVFLGAPLVVALASLFTRLRRDRGKQISIWVIAGIVTIFTTLPLLVIWLGLSTEHVDEHRFVVE
ncbi:hypothetical protein [Microbacterium saperdae]|uniref:Uncharacterized protein n=1 Tax=Microbacterium saperdae TaxID=69368 RepID=A0A543BBV6_9MICO|nr:hypothetical protein [Microbacterium saperdae]TQL82223.1 hypothetical protein FB560_3707 [Microbacterium saperdae]GGM38141.1 hypothetical protein GCM10010489_06410 [Microbacterium saperdae]